MTGTRRGYALFALLLKTTPIRRFVDALPQPIKENIKRLHPGVRGL
jgi:hypothetical protein